MSTLWLMNAGRDVDFDAHKATLKFQLGTQGVQAIPAKGDSMAQYIYGPNQQSVGGSWYVDTRSLTGTINPTLTVVARQPGFDWTWVGLAPIAKYDRALIIASPYWTGSAYTMGYSPLFSNWNTAWNTTTGDAYPLGGQVSTWEIEAVDTVNHANYLGKVNGTWPTGWEPPGSPAAGTYICKRIEVRNEPYFDAITGAKYTVYRHFATFWVAPMFSTTQLIWIGATW